MLAQIARFEIRYQLRQPLFWSVFTIFFLLSFGVITVDQVKVGAGGNVAKNSPFALAQLHLVWTLFFMFVTAAFAANVVIRDDETGFGPIVRTTPVRKGAYLYGRFAGAFVMVAACYLSVPLGVFAGSLMPWVDAQTLVPNEPHAYAYAFFFLALPGLLVTSAIFFALATAVRSIVATWLGVVAFFVAWAAANTLLDDPAQRPLVALLEPFGFAAFSEATRYWTAADRNGLVPPIAGPLLYNRLLWIGISLLFLAAAHRIFRFEERKRRVRATEAPAQPPPVRHGRPLPAARFGPRTTATQFAVRTRFEVRQVVRSPAFLVLLELGVVNAAMALWNMQPLYGVDLHPVTRMMIETLTGAFGIFPVIVATYYAGELVWREREHRISPLVDATPAPDLAFLVPKVAALCLVLVSMLVLSSATAIAVQALRGYHHFELGNYLAWYILPGAVDWALLAVLAIFLQVVAPSKQAGWGLMLLYLISTLVLSNLGFEHNLYQYGGTPAVPLSDMNGAGDFATAANWFRLYWTAFALLLVLLGHLLWPRGAQALLAGRFARLPRRLAGRTGAVAASVLLLAACSGGWIFVNTNVWNEYATTDEEEEQLAAMEREILRYEGLEQPRVKKVELALDLHPRAPRLLTTGSYVVENHTGEEMELALLGFHDDLIVEELELEGARLEKAYERWGYRLYRFDPPLPPGATRTLSFRTVLAQRGFRNGGNTTRLVDNGTFVNNAEFAPLFGVMRSGFLEEKAKRRKHGLPEELRPRALEDEAGRRRNYLGVDWVEAEIAVTTDADQTPVAPGTRVADVTEGGRRTARFVTDAPILHFFSVQSAAYEVERAEHGGVELAVFHDPRHRYNVQRMIDALKLSLDTFQEAFGPYQFRHVRIVEFPDYAKFAQAFAGTIPYSEGVGFIAAFEDPEAVDYVTYVTAHELAHQWWAHQLLGADVQGATLLSETLAQYGALLVMERMYGPHQIRRFLEHELDQYLRSRSGELVEEMPLLRVENQPYVHYRKGSLVMYLLKERLGEETVNRALRGLLARYRFAAAPWATSQDLVDALRAEAGPEHEELISDLFERIVLFDLRADEALVTKREDGRFDVELAVSARKLHADGLGRENEVAIGETETFDVGLFRRRPGKEGFGAEDVLHFERVRLAAGQQRLRFTVDEAPAFAGVDPYVKQIDRDAADNVVAVR